MSDQQIQSGLVITPTAGIDPLDALATSMYASPGLYAVLLGAGISLSAGQLSAWGILRDLIKKVAKSSGDDLDTSQESPESWWKRKTGEEPLYGEVLQSLASTPGARQQLLQGYFQPNQDGRQSEITYAHKHLAELCATGKIKVVLTTNFDRLVEQALSAEGVDFQLIQPRDIPGMIPLVHAPVTVIKLHGDYQSIDIRNTPKELSQYPRRLTMKLREIFRDFGLIVVGWSGEWDSALGDLIQGNASRIYPMYWVAHNGKLSEKATRLVENRQAIRIDSGGADEFFSGLRLRIDRLTQVAQRKQRPTFLRNIQYSPWVYSQFNHDPPPRLLLRAAVTLGPANIDDSGVVTPVERRKIVAALDCHRLSNQLRDFAAVGGLFASSPKEFRDAMPRWGISTMDGAPSGDSIAFRLNLDLQQKVFARLIVQSPANNGVSGNFLSLLDIGLTVVFRKLTLNEVAEILKGGLDILTNVIPEALADVAPPHVLSNRADLYVSRPEGKNRGRSTDLDQYLDLSSWGPPVSPPEGGLDHLTAAFQLHGPLTSRDVLELTIRAIERMALKAGYIAYESGIERLRNEMRIASSN